MENIVSVRNPPHFSFSQGSMGVVFGCEGCTVDQLTSGNLLEKEKGTSIWTNDIKWPRFIRCHMFLRTSAIIAMIVGFLLREKLQETLYLMVKTMVSCRLFLEPIQWYDLPKSDTPFLLDFRFTSRRMRRLTLGFVSRSIRSCPKQSRGWGING